MPLYEGIYAGVPGPQYETPAEVRMLRVLGADAVGMSTVLEALEARALGLEVAGFSCLTNWAAGLGPEPLSHEEVLATGRRRRRARAPAAAGIRVSEERRCEAWGARASSLQGAASCRVLVRTRVPGFSIGFSRSKRFAQ